MTPADIFNFIEIGLWAMFAILVALFGSRANLTGRNRAILSIALIAFSFSDYVELRTGAWWRPWWLLVLKGTCLVCFACVAWAVWTKVEKSPEPSDRSETRSHDDSIRPEPSSD